MESRKIIFWGVTLSIFSAAATLFASCDSHTYEEAAGVVANPVYTTNIRPIVQNNCISCHSAENGQTPYFDTYDQFKNETQNGELLCRISGESCGSVMPESGRMPQVNIDLITTWAANGCPEQ